MGQISNNQDQKTISKQERMAKALRENLYKRKQQQRSRSEKQQQKDEGGSEDYDRRCPNDPECDIE